MPRHDLGCHSLHLSKVSSLIKEKFHIDITLQLLRNDAMEVDLTMLIGHRQAHTFLWAELACPLTEAEGPSRQGPTYGRCHHL